jgi:glutathione S-transferase
MKLFGHPHSSCTRKVLFVAAEKGAPIELVTVDLFAGAHKQPEHLARHPFGVIPVLEHGDFRLFESRAILRYLDGVLPGASFSPSDLRARARVDQWLSVDQSYVAPHTRTLALQRIVHPHLGLPRDDAAIENAERELGKALAVYDAALNGEEFLVAGAVSLADLSLAPYVASLPMLEASHLIARLPRLAAWWERIAARPAWKQVVAA